MREPLRTIILTLEYCGTCKAGLWYGDAGVCHNCTRRKQPIFPKTGKTEPLSKVMVPDTLEAYAHPSADEQKREREKRRARRYKGIQKTNRDIRDFLSMA